MAYIVAKSGLQTIGNLGLLIGTLYVACLLLRLRGAVGPGPDARLQPVKLLRYIREELLIVLGTSSTEPVLPPCC